MKNFNLLPRYNLAIAIIAILFTNYAAVSEEVREFIPRTARISYLEGSVTTQRTADEDWTDATLNLPLMVGDKIYTGINGQVELELEDEVVVRLGSDTYIHFANLEDTLTRIGILKGTMAINAGAVPYQRAPIEVQANGFLAITKDWSKTRYNVGEDGISEILVRRGNLIVAQGDADERLQRGDQVRITAPNARAFEKINQEDGFDQWCDLRDAMQAASISRNHISSRVAGYSDLDRHGEWVDIPKYGTVWRPTVVVKEWAPYRDGRWVWYDSCGWTWVSYEPWGWAPYHYGRWVYVKNYNWCWTPHTEIIYVRHHPIRPVWHPALVSFTYARKGSYFHLSVGGGRSHWNDPCIGWFALGPRDPYIPWHRRHGGGHGRGGGNNVINGHGNKIENNTYITNNTYIYQNQDAPNSVTVVKENEFASNTPGTRAIAQIKPSRGKEVIVGSAAIQRVEQKRVTPTRARRDAGSTEDYQLAVKASNNTATSTPRAARPTKDAQNRSPETVATSSQRTTTTTAARTEPERNASSNVRSETQRRTDTSTAAQATQRTSPQRTERTTQSTAPARSNTETKRTTTTQTAPTAAAKTTERRSLIQDRPVSQSADTQTTRQTNSPERTSTTTQPRTTQPARSQTSATRERIMTTHPAREAASTQSSRSTQRQSVTTPTRDSYRQSTTMPQRENRYRNSATTPPRDSYRQSATTPQTSNYRQSSSSAPQRSYSQSRTAPGNSSGATYQSSAPRTTNSAQRYSAPQSSSNQRSSATSESRSSTRSNSRTSSKRR